MLEVEKEFSNLYLEHDLIKGEINICAVYDGKKLIHNPRQQDKEKYKDTFVKDCYEIKINPSTSKVYEVGNKIVKIADYHINCDESCCLGLFKKEGDVNLVDFIKNYVLPFFVWQAYYQKHNAPPPWGEWSHGDAGRKESEEDIKKIGRNNMCFCGSNKKYKKCCKI